MGMLSSDYNYVFLRHARQLIECQKFFHLSPGWKLIVQFSIPFATIVSRSPRKEFTQFSGNQTWRERCGHLEKNLEG